MDTQIELKPEDVTAIAVYSDMEQTGFFEGSNELLNRFVDATLWSTMGNSLDIPMDCPTRERHGWTGDAQIFLKQPCNCLTMPPSRGNIYVMFMTGRRKAEDFRKLHPMVA